MKKVISQFLKQHSEQQQPNIQENSQNFQLKLNNIPYAQEESVKGNFQKQLNFSPQLNLFRQENQQGSVSNQSKSSQFHDSDIFETAEKFEKSLIQMISDKGISFSLFEKKKLQKVKKLVSQILDDNLQSSPSAKSIPQSPNKYFQAFSPCHSNKNNTMELQLEDCLSTIKYRYKDLKHFMSEVYNQLVLIMEENIQFSTLKKVLRDLGNLFFGIHEFSFIAEDNNMTLLYQSQSDIYTLVQEDAFIVDLNKQLNKFKNDEFFDFTNEELNKVLLIDGFQSNIAYKFKQGKFNILFVIHCNEQKKDSFYRYLKQNSEQNDINLLFKDYSSFTIDSVRQGKTNFFSPLASGSIVLDISSKFLNRLHILLKDIIIDVLKEKLEQNIILADHEDDLIQKGGKLLFSINDLYSNKFYYYGTADNIFLPKSIHQISSKLNKIYGRIIQLLTQQDERLVLHKYFIKTPNKLYFEYNKVGELIFLNQPINHVQKQRYGITMNFKMIEEYNLLFEQMFKNNKKVLEEVKLGKISYQKQNNFFPSIYFQEIEYYFRNIEEHPDGFIIVINETDFSNFDNSSNYIRERLGSFSAKSSSHKEKSESNGLITLNSIDEKQELSLEQQKQVKSKMQKVVSFQETIRYIQDLKEKEPGVGDSQLQMFFPSDFKKEGKNSTSSLIMGRFKTKQISRSKRKPSQEKKIQGISPSKKKEGIPFQIRYDTSIFVHYEDDPDLQCLDWNALELKTTKEMHRTAWRLFDKQGWIDKYQIPVDVFIEFLMEVERKYNKNKNPFHNYLHGIAVMQCAFTLSKSKKISQYLDDFQQFVLTFSGLCHDISHKARTNIFMVNSMDKLAIRYNDDSVNERHHIATTFMLLQDDRFNIFKNMSFEQFKELRKLAISNIIYTDISKHFPLMKDFSKTFKPIQEQNQQRQSFDQDGELFNQHLQFGSGSDDLILLQGIILHTSDFTGGAKPFPISRIWSERVNLEFSAQYEEEGRRGLAQTPFFKDLHKPHIAAKGEIGFFKFIVQPLWVLLNEFSEGEFDKSCNYLNEVIDGWQQIQDQNTPNEQNTEKNDSKQLEINQENSNLDQQIEIPDQSQNDLQQLNKAKTVESIQSYQKDCSDNE